MTDIDSYKAIERSLREMIAMEDIGKLDNPRFGICYNLGRWVNMPHGGRVNSYMVVMLLAVGWEHHSGCEVYPVPETLCLSSCSEYPKWSGEQLGLRKSLLIHMLDNLVNNFSSYNDLRRANYLI